MVGRRYLEAMAGIHHLLPRNWTSGTPKASLVEVLRGCLRTVKWTSSSPHGGGSPVDESSCHDDQPRRALNIKMLDSPVVLLVLS